MYDNGVYMGNMCLADMNRVRLAEERNNLKEVASIIASFLNREKYDLASRAKSEFLSRMSHEIRTPMNGIMGMTEIALRDNKDVAHMTDCLYKIRNSSQYLLGLINDILDMSRIESGKMQLNEEAFDLHEILETLEELLRPQAEEKDIVFTIQKEIDEWNVYGDQLRISQVLINLLGNAVKFTDNGGSVQLIVRSTRLGEKVRLYFAVTDDGTGIAHEDQKRIFESFEQGRSNQVSSRQGTGLGLAIAKKIVEAHDGVIELVKFPKEGLSTEFRIWMHTDKE